jgi:hypothetical protein
MSRAILSTQCFLPGIALKAQPGSGLEIDAGLTQGDRLPETQVASDIAKAET